MLENLKYLEIQCSTAVTVAKINQFPYLLIWGNGFQNAWSKPEILQREPKMFRCVGNFVYFVTHDDTVYKIDTQKKTAIKVDQEGDDAMDG